MRAGCRRPYVLGMVRRGDVDVVVLASPSAARNLVDILGSTVELRSMNLACIGPTTADAVAVLFSYGRMVGEGYLRLFLPNCFGWRSLCLCLLPCWNCGARVCFTKSTVACEGYLKEKTVCP